MAFRPRLTRVNGAPAPYLALNLQEGEVMREAGTGGLLYLDGVPSVIALVDHHGRILVFGFLYPDSREPEEFEDGLLEAAVEYDAQTDSAIVRVVEMPPAVRLIRYAWLDLLLRADSTFVGIRVFGATRHLPEEILPPPIRRPDGLVPVEPLPIHPDALNPTDVRGVDLDGGGGPAKDGVWAPMALPLRVDLRLGAVLLANVELVDYSMRPAMDESTALLVVDPEQLREQGVNYGGAAVVEDVRNNRRLFSGLVKESKVEASSVSVTLEGLESELAEIKSLGIAVPAGNNGLEIVHAMLRSIGIPNDRMRLPELPSGQGEAFLAVVPVVGAVLTGSYSLLDVGVTDTNPADLRDFPGDLSQAFCNAPAWAYTTVVADTMYEAEEVASSKLSDALATLHLLLSFSYPEISGALRPYHRQTSRARVDLDKKILIASLTSQRRWLHATSNLATPADVNIGEQLPDWGARVAPDADLKSAIREWSRATRADDRLSAVSHLWRSVEFYARAAEVPVLFDSSDRKRLRALIGADWTNDQRERLDVLIQQLNNAPLAVRLRAAISQDGLALTPNELSLLLETRQLRNDLEHGRVDLLEPNQEIDRRVADALSIMNNALVQRLGRMADGLGGA